MIKITYECYLFIMDYLCIDTLREVKSKKKTQQDKLFGKSIKIN